MTRPALAALALACMPSIARAAENAAEPAAWGWLATVVTIALWLGGGLLALAALAIGLLALVRALGLYDWRH